MIFSEYLLWSLFRRFLMLWELNGTAIGRHFDAQHWTKVRMWMAATRRCRSKQFIRGWWPNGQQIRTAEHDTFEVEQLYGTPAQLSGYLTSFSIRLCIRFILAGRLLAVQHE